ncbi:glycosyltransferase family 2 protein [Thermococcus peptonophilus]|uniref:glycosyltransferase family 2 protein n=1 Tax=Thermococcus peptonophilus TaxID=53952 RepID=UPI003467B219
MASKDCGEKINRILFGGIYGGKHMKEGLVSVIMPVYMDYPYIIKTLDSIISQTYRPIEVLIVYTPGDEKTLDVIENASQNYEFIRILESEARGPSPARNIGIRKSRGEYIVFIDADDYWDSNFLDACIRAIKEYSADTCVTDYYIIFENGKRNRVANLVKFPTVLDFLNEKAWIRAGNSVLSSKIIKKQA